MIVEGRVQGVCFRMYTRMEAGRMGVTGWVRNRADGTVEVMAEGEENALDEFIAWCAHGPDEARVDRITKEFSEATGEFSGFQIRP